MNKLIETRNGFLSGVVDKWDYIDKMYNIHSTLYEYAEYIDSTNISSIEIIGKRVLMTFRDSGIRFICTENDKRLAPLDTLNFGYYEHDELIMQLKLIENGYNVLDIGGNYGWYAMHVASEKPEAKIFSFEPIPSTFNFLNENIRLNNLRNIKTFNFGLSDADGSFNFYFDPHLSVNASLANISGNKEVENITCFVKKLDNFVKDQNIKIDFIKCDVEGAELLVFKGGTEVIKKDCPIIFTEMLRKWSTKFNYHPNDIIFFLQSIGYSCFTTIEGKLSIFNIVDESTKETNYFFLHKKKHASQIEKFQRIKFQD
jgi:FkbM family methyltransferase